MELASKLLYILTGLLAMIKTFSRHLHIKENWLGKVPNGDFVCMDSPKTREHVQFVIYEYYVHI